MGKEIVMALLLLGIVLVGIIYFYQDIPELSPKIFQRGEDTGVSEISKSDQAKQTACLEVAGILRNVEENKKLSNRNLRSLKQSLSTCSDGSKIPESDLKNYLEASSNTRQTANCKADIVPNGVIDVFDLIELLGNWNTNGPGADIIEPLDVVDVFDLIELLNNWAELCGGPIASEIKVFVTSETWNGNLGGLSGADAKCQAAASSVGLTGEWKAWLSTPGNGNAAKERLYPYDDSLPVSLLNGSIVANNWSDLLDGQLNTHIRIKENGQFLPLGEGTTVYTGTNADGMLRENSHCAEWSFSSGTGLYGLASDTDPDWTEFTQGTCGSERHLYCFENINVGHSEPICGNGIREDKEECDGNDLGGICENYGFYSGHLSCSSECTIEINQCFNPTIINVGPTRPITSIQEGIDLAQEGEVVEIDPGVYNEKISLPGVSIRVVGVEGPENTIIDATGIGGSVVTFDENSFTLETLLDGITIRGGNGTPDTFSGEISGGGIFADQFSSGVKIRNCIIRDNVADSLGGGIYSASAGFLVVEDCLFENNTAQTAGAIFAAASSMEISNSIFKNNRAGSFGGAVEILPGNHFLTNLLFVNNSAGIGGGAIYTRHLTNSISYTNAQIDSSSFYANNVEDGRPGSVALARYILTNLSITNSIIQGNQYNSFSPNGISIQTTDDAKVEVLDSNVQNVIPVPEKGIFNEPNPWVGPENGNFNLRSDSLSLDFGKTMWLQDDLADLDRDSDMEEPTPLDLAYSDRVKGSSNDLGCYELSVSSSCGDGTIDSEETCEDGNTEDGDGCSSACRIEFGHSCSGNPSTCVNIDPDDDFIFDPIDNCPNAFNPEQNDSDGDGLGDVCDPQWCGNGIVEVGEDCDDSDFGGNTCQSLGFPGGGTLECTQSCEFDTNLCIPTTEFTSVFITSDRFYGSSMTGGLSGADAKCQAAAVNAGLSGTWFAWLSDTQTNAADRHGHSNLPYYQLNGAKVADNWDDLIDGTIDNPISIDEFAEFDPVGDTGVWTYTLSDGTADLASGNACEDWTGDLQDSTEIGANYRTDSWWTDSINEGCNNFNRLYCFEQSSN